MIVTMVEQPQHDNDDMSPPSSSARDHVVQKECQKCKLTQSVDQYNIKKDGGLTNACLEKDTLFKKKPEYKEKAAATAR